MLGVTDCAYFRRRAIQERQMAERAINLHAQAAHAEMARAYELRIAIEYDIGHSKRDDAARRPLRHATA